MSCYVQLLPDNVGGRNSTTYCYFIWPQIYKLQVVAKSSSVCPQGAVCISKEYNVLRSFSEDAVSRKLQVQVLENTSHFCIILSKVKSKMKGWCYFEGKCNTTTVICSERRDSTTYNFMNCTLMKSYVP